MYLYELTLGAIYIHVHWNTAVFSPVVPTGIAYQLGCLSF